MSGAPVIRGLSKFPKAPIIIRTTKKIILYAWVVMIT